MSWLCRCISCLCRWVVLARLWLSWVIWWFISLVSGGCGLDRVSLMLVSGRFS